MMLLQHSDPFNIIDAIELYDRIFEILLISYSSSYSGNCSKMNGCQHSVWFYASIIEMEPETDLDTEKSRYYFNKLVL